MRTLMPTLAICLVAPAVAALAQDAKPAAAAPAPAPDRPPAFNKMAYGFVKGNLLRSAEKMPEENYGFRPTDAVRSFGQVVGHVADAQYLFCAVVLGDKNPAPKSAESKTSKAELIAALKDGFAYCDRAFDGMTDAKAVEIVKMFGRDTPKLGVLSGCIFHDMEHYGNLVTYMRLKNVVPPTSEQAAPAMGKKQEQE